MRAQASILGHPLHAMLVPLPIGLWVFSLVSDIIFHVGWGGPVWYDVAFYTMAGGTVGALLAALPGFADIFGIEKPKTLVIALTHMSINLLAVVVFAVDLVLRMRGSPNDIMPIGLSIVGVILIGVSGWLGGEMVYVRGVGVERPREQVL